MNKINFLWRENYIDYLWATETTGKHYFFHSGYLVYRDGVLSAYATDKELKEALLLTKHLVDSPERLLEIEDKFIEVKKQIDSFHNFFKKIDLKKVNKKDLYKLYEDIIRVYGEYIEAYRFTEPHLVDHIETKVKKIVSGVKSNKNKDTLLSELLSDKAKLKKYNIEKHEDIFNLIHSVSEVRFKAKQIADDLAEDVEEILFETARRTNYAASQISNLSLREIKGLILDNKKINTYKPNMRSKKFGVSVEVKNNKSKVSILDDSQIKKIEDQDKRHNNEKTLRGDSVYHGCVEGITRIVPKLFSEKNYEKYLSSLKRGDIIVAPMTSPSLTIGFSKVSGVITDEGGLMSHAALVSREKKVPCIVGTKNATRILKEGDKIILDADNGIIKKIK